MKVIAEFTLAPIGVGPSLSPYVAACADVPARAGVKAELHANGTNLEGEWDAVPAAVRLCHGEVHRTGAPRIFTTLKLGTRADREQTMEQKVASVEGRRRARASGKDPAA